MAERVGFEPTVHCCTHDFQSCRFGRSRTSPSHNDYTSKAPFPQVPPGWMHLTAHLPLATHGDSVLTHFQHREVHGDVVLSQRLVNCLGYGAQQHTGQGN